MSAASRVGLRGKFVIMAPTGFYRPGGPYTSDEMLYTESETDKLAWQRLLQSAYSSAMVAYAIEQGYRLRTRRT